MRTEPQGTKAVSTRREGALPGGRSRGGAHSASSTALREKVKKVPHPRLGSTHPVRTTNITVDRRHGRENRRVVNCPTQAGSSAALEIVVALAVLPQALVPLSPRAQLLGVQLQRRQQQPVWPGWRPARQRARRPTRRQQRAPPAGPAARLCQSRRRVGRAAATRAASQAAPSSPPGHQQAATAGAAERGPEPPASPRRGCA